MTFEEYVQQYLDRLSRLAAVLTYDRGLAEDVVQTVLERALRQWDRIAASDSPHAYVRRMVVNEFVSWHRRWSRAVPVEDMADLVPHSPDHADRLVEAVVMLSLVSGLPRRQRACVVLRYYEGLGDAEIAEVLGCGVSTVRSNMSRALAGLRVSGRSTLPTEAL